MNDGHDINDAVAFRSLWTTTIPTDHPIKIYNSSLAARPFIFLHSFSLLSAFLCSLLSSFLPSAPLLIILVFSFPPTPRRLTCERDIQPSEWKSAWCLVCKA